MSTLPNDPLAGMEEGALTLNEGLASQEAETKSAPPEQDTSEEVDTSDDAGEDTSTEEKPDKKNKIPRDQRIKDLTGKNKDLQRQLEELKNGPLQSQIDEIKKLLTPPENSGNIPVNRDAEPDPSDLQKYRLGDLDPAYTRDLARYEVRQELAAEHQRKVQQEARVQQERQASETLGKVSELAGKGAALHEDYVETVVQPFMQGKLPLEEHTFLAATEAEHGAEVLRDLALNPDEAIRVASLTPYQQTKYVETKSNEIAAKKKPRLPGAAAPPNSQARGNGVNFGVRGDGDDLDAIEKTLYQRR